MRVPLRIVAGEDLLLALVIGAAILVGVSRLQKDTTANGQIVIVIQIVTANRSLMSTAQLETLQRSSQRATACLTLRACQYVAIKLY